MQYESYHEVMAAAKKAFEDIKRTSYEKQKGKKNNPLKLTTVKIGFIDGMREIAVWR